MKKTSFLFICILLINIPIQGAPKDDVFKELARQLAKAEKKMKQKTVAVYGFEIIGRADDSYTKYATEKLTHELVNNSDFTVIERSHIDQIMSEQKLSLTGAVDLAGAARLGKILAVEGVIIGSIRITNDEVEYLVRVVQSENAVILASAQAGYETQKDPGVKSAISDTGETQTNEAAIKASAPVVLSSSKKTYRTGEKITISYSGMPGNAYDWITLVKKDDPPDHYREWFYTKGMKKGGHTFNAVNPGEYEVRAFYDWPRGGYIIQKKLLIKVK